MAMLGIDVLRSASISGLAVFVPAVIMPIPVSIIIDTRIVINVSREVCY